MRITESSLISEHKRSTSVCSVIAPLDFVDGGIFRTKTELGFVVELARPDRECWEPVRIEEYADSCRKAFSVFDQDWHLYQYLFREQGVDLASAYHGNPLIEQALEERAQLLSPLYQNRMYLVGLKARAQTDEVKQVAGQFPGKLLDRLEVYAFLEKIFNLQHIGNSGRVDSFIGWLAAESNWQAYPSHVSIGDYKAVVLALRNHQDCFPREMNVPDYMRPLTVLEGDYYLCLEWHRYSEQVGRSLVGNSRKLHHQSKDSVKSSENSSALTDAGIEASVDELGEGQKLLSQGASLGQISLTAVCWSKWLEQAEATANRILTAGNSIDLRFQRLKNQPQKRSALAAYLATIPGNHKLNFNYRRALDTNFTYLSLCFGVASGQLINEHLRAEYLMALETREHTPYFFCPHVADIAHAVLTGLTGAGKSFFVNALVLHLVVKYGAWVLLSDWGGSYEWLVRFLGGAYCKLDRSYQGKVNPFAREETPENVSFLTRWMQVLLEHGARKLEPHQTDIVYEDVGWLLGQKWGRCLGRLVSENKLDRELRERLERKLKEFGWLIDSEEDTLSISDLQCFDFQGLESYPQLAELLFMDLFNRAEAVMSDPAQRGRLKATIWDEAWVFVSNPVVSDEVRKFLKTQRKLNAFSLLSTQTGGTDLSASSILDVIVECCATKLFLHNPTLDMDLYSKRFHLSDTVVRMIPKLAKKKEVLLVRSEEEKVLQLKVPEIMRLMFSTDPKDVIAKQAAGEDWLKEMIHENRNGNSLLTAAAGAGR